MNEKQAEVIHALLDAETESNWPGTAATMKERGFKPQEIIGAWESLEKTAGMAGGVPGFDDF